MSKSAIGYEVDTEDESNSNVIINAFSKYIDTSKTIYVKFCKYPFSVTYFMHCVFLKVRLTGNFRSSIRGARHENN